MNIRHKFDTQYDIIIIGATFSALGAIYNTDKNALIVERRSDVGYEFINSYKWNSCGCVGQQDTSCKLLIHMQQQGVVSDEQNIFLPETLPFLYHKLLNDNIPVLLMTEIINVEQCQDGFVVDAYNAEGYRQFKAKEILDTTHGLSLSAEKRPKIIRKSINALLWNTEADTDISFDRGDFCIVPTCKNSIAIFKMPVATDAAMSEFRCRLHDLWVNVRGQFENYKIANVANCFDITLDKNFYTIADKFSLLASCNFSTPFEAYNAGEKYMRGDWH